MIGSAAAAWGKFSKLILVNYAINIAIVFRSLKLWSKNIDKTFSKDYAKYFS